MNFRVVQPHGTPATREARFASSSRRPAVRLTGSIGISISESVRRLADTTLRSYAHDLLHFLRWWESVHHTGDRRRRRSHRIDACSTMCDSSPARNPSCRLPPSTTALPLSIAPCASPFPTLPARSLPAFSTATGGERRWASAGRGRP